MFAAAVSVLALCALAVPATQDAPQKKVADPFAVLKAQGRAISVQGADGKERKLPQEKLAAQAIRALLDSAKSYSFTLTAKGVKEAVRVEVKDRQDKDRYFRT